MSRVSRKGLTPSNTTPPSPGYERLQRGAFSKVHARTWSSALSLPAIGTTLSPLSTVSSSLPRRPTTRPKFTLFPNSICYPTPIRTAIGREPAACVGQRIQVSIRIALWVAVCSKPQEPPNNINPACIPKDRFNALAKKTLDVHALVMFLLSGLSVSPQRLLLEVRLNLNPKPYISNLSITVDCCLQLVSS